MWSRIAYLTEGSSTTQAQIDIAIPHTCMIYVEHMNATYNQTDDASVTILVLNEFARFSVKDKSETLSSTICTPFHERQANIQIIS